MTNRSVTVELRALVNSYVANIRQAGQATKDFASKGSKYIQDHSAELNQLGNQAAITGGLITLGVGKAVKTYADFDREMSRVGSTGNEAKRNLEGLRATAMRLGADTQYSAQEAAQGITDMLKAGMSAKDVIEGGLSGALALAASDQLDVAFAAETTAVALKMFGLEGRQASHVADLLAAGSNAAMGGVTEMAQALKYVGPVAAGMNISLEETVGVLTALASEGILADQAGTSLRGVLSSLTSPSAAARKELDRLGITLYDQEGRFLGLSHMAGQLDQAYSGATDAQKDMSLGIIFGNQQLTAARILLKQGEDGLRDWTDQANQAGFAQRQAAQMTDNLVGDLERLGGSLDTVFIQGGGGANRVLRQMAQGAESVVDWVGQIPGPLLETVVMLTGAGGLATLGVGGILKLAAAAGDAKRNFALLGVSAKTAKWAVAGVGGALAIGTLALSAWAAATAEANGRIAQLGDTLEIVEDKAVRTSETWRKINETLTTTRDNIVGWMGLGPTLADVMDMIGVSASDAQGFINGEADAIDRVRAAQAAWIAEHGAWSNGMDLSAVERFDDALTGIQGELTEAEKQVLQLARANEETGAATNDAADSSTTHAKELQKQEEAARKTADELNALIDSLYGVRDANSALIAGESSLEAAIDSARDAIDKKNLAVLKGADINNLNNPTIREANGELREIANSAAAYSKELLNQGKSQELADQQMRIGAAAIMRQAEKWGLAEDEVLEFTEAVTGVPKSQLTKITVAGARRAEEFLQSVEDGVVAIPDDKVVQVAAAVESGSIKKVKAAIKDLPDEQQVDILTQLKRQGFKDADEELGKLAKKLAKKYDIDVDGKSAKQVLKEIKAELDKIKSKTVNVHYTSSGSPKAGVGGDADGGLHAATANGLVRQFAGGGFGQPQVRPFQGSAGVRWGEEGSGPWEAFISGAPQKRDRSIAIWREVGRRLLGSFSAEDVLAFADGGLLDHRLEMTRLETQIRDLKRDLKAKEKYRPNKKSKKTKTRYKLRGLDREAAKLELAIAQQDLADARLGIDQLTDLARDQVGDLSGIASSVRSALGGIDLKSLGGGGWKQSTDSAGNTWWTSGGVSASSITQAASSRVSKVAQFVEKLQRLQAAGMSPAALESIWRLGADEGMPYVDAYLEDTGQIAQLNSAYSAMDAWTGVAAQSITEASYTGGLSAAEAMVATLEKSGAKIGAQVASGFADSLGYNLKGGMLQKREPIAERYDQPSYMAPGGSVTTITRTVNLTVNTHNAVAEASSVTADKALAFVAMLGGDDQ